MSAMNRRRALLAMLPALLAEPVFAQERGLAKSKRPENSDLPALDDYFGTFVMRQRIPGLSVALTKNSKLVYNRGFGLANIEKNLPMLATSQQRIASISKTITAVAILQCVQNKKLKLDTPILDVLAWKPYPQLRKKQDPRWKEVTVLHCLQHTQGNDRDLSFDPLDKTWEILKELGLPAPLSAEATAQYMLSQPLDFDPGTRYSYGNVGFLLLGRIIERITKKKYAEYVQQEIWKPLGVSTASIARAVPANRPKNEVSYYEANAHIGTSFYPPTTGQMVAAPDGASNIEAFEGHSGWVTTARDLVRFACDFDTPAKAKLLNEESIEILWQRPTIADTRKRPGTNYYGCGWNVRRVMGGVNCWHFGILAGVSSLVVRRSDGHCWSVLANGDYLPGTKQEITGQLAEGIHPVVDGIRVWPDKDGFDSPLK